MGWLDSANSEPIICAICEKPLGLNRFAIGKTESGKVLWKCPECAHKGGYLRIVGEKAYFCTKDGEILDREKHPELPKNEPIKKESLPKEKQRKSKRYPIGKIILASIAILCALLVIVFLLSDRGNSGGDGKTTCRNCGREKPLSAFGFCSTCQKGFNEWQEDEYEKDHYVPKE